jgi:hypothetical protein
MFVYDKDLCCRRQKIVCALLLLQNATVTPLPSSPYHGIAEILLQVALNTINLIIKCMTVYILGVDVVPDALLRNFSSRKIEILTPKNSMRIVAASECNSYSPTQFSILFQWQSKVVAPVFPFLL